MKRLGMCILILAVCVCGCAVRREDKGKLRDVEYTVTGEAELSEELLERIEEKKEESFELTYTEGDWLYAVRGYGSQPTGGYSIQVDDCYETTDTIRIRTTLNGPSAQEQRAEETTYPWVALKMEYTEKEIMFE